MFSWIIAFDIFSDLGIRTHAENQKCGPGNIDKTDNDSKDFFSVGFVVLFNLCMHNLHLILGERFPV